VLAIGYIRRRACGKQLPCITSCPIAIIRSSVRARKHPTRYGELAYLGSGRPIHRTERIATTKKLAPLRSKWRCIDLPCNTKAQQIGIKSYLFEDEANNTYPPIRSLSKVIVRSIGMFFKF